MADPLNERQLRDALDQLPLGAFERIVNDLGLPTEHMRLGGRRAEATNDVMLVARQQGKEDRLQALVAEQRGAAPSGPLDLWMASRYSSFGAVPIVGFEDRDRISLHLDLTFVPLSVMPVGLPERELQSQESPAQVDLPGALRQAEAVRGDRPNVGLVLLGDPGAGKTTLLRQLFRQVRREGSADVGLPPGLVPVLLPFSRVQPADLRDRGLAEAVRREAAENGFPGNADALSDGRGLLVLLDGLDELKDEATRASTCGWLVREVANWPGSRFVATCRRAAWTRASRLGNQFIPVDVLGLGESQIRDYVQRWFQAVHRGKSPRPDAAVDQAADAEAGRLLAVLLARERHLNARLREMSENPLLLGVLCMVHHLKNELPKKRGQLYDDCLRILIEAWGKEGKKRYLPDKEAREVLKPLAWAMQVQGVRAIGMEAAKRVVAEPLRQVGSGLEDGGLAPSDFLERVSTHCGVLRTRDLESYEFFHGSFQEFLAATHARDAGLMTELARHASEPAWREVVLLAMTTTAALRTFSTELLRSGDAAIHAALLRDCFADAPGVDERPFAEVLSRATSGTLRGWWHRLRRSAPSDASLAAILDLFRGRDAPAVKEHARRLAEHPGVGVRAAARALFQVAASAPLAETETAAIGMVWTVAAVQMAFVRVPAGDFLMGSSKTPGEPGHDEAAYDDETPPRRVRITKAFWMGQHTVTNEQYARFLAETGYEEPAYWTNSRFNRPVQPVVGVSHADALAFCAWASAKVAPQGLECSLPTEAQWEWAARGPEGRRYPWGDADPTPERAVFDLPVETGAPAEVGGRPSGATPLGIHDMAGNVWEWCADAWRERYPPLSTVDSDPCHEGNSAAPRVIRGGSWSDPAGRLRAAYRLRLHPGYRDWLLGFRVVCRGFPEHVA